MKECKLLKYQESNAIATQQATKDGVRTCELAFGLSPRNWWKATERVTLYYTSYIVTCDSCHSGRDL